MKEPSKFAQDFLYMVRKSLLEMERRKQHRHSGTVKEQQDNEKGRSEVKTQIHQGKQWKDDDKTQLRKQLQDGRGDRLYFLAGLKAKIQSIAPLLCFAMTWSEKPMCPK